VSACDAEDAFGDAFEDAAAEWWEEEPNSSQAPSRRERFDDLVNDLVDK